MQSTEDRPDGQDRWSPSQADAIARAILDSDVKAQEQLQRQRAARAHDMAQRRLVAWMVLAGGAIGAGIAFSADVRFTIGALWGGIAGAAVGWLVVAFQRSRAATAARSDQA